MIPEKTRNLMIQSGNIRKVLIKAEKEKLKTLYPFNYVDFYIRGVQSHSIINVLGVAYDGCHKIYLLLSKSDVKKAKSRDYKIHHITELNALYHGSCGLQFIYSWDIRIQFISQDVMSRDVQIKVKDYKAEQLSLIKEMELLDVELKLKRDYTEHNWMATP